jgi:chemotaxis protein methyltransferase CheR
MTAQEFARLSALVQAQTGIALGPHKRSHLASRLARRLREVGLPSFADYYELLATRDPEGREMVQFVNAVTTNKTDFFREAHHFTFLTDTWAPAVRARTLVPRVRAWSAGCSTGEEAYTLAWTLRGALGPGADLRVLASDIDTEVLAQAETGIYTQEAVAPVPAADRPRYFLRGTGANVDRVRVRPELRALVTFRRINLLDATWPIRTEFDVIMCRNVVIYFDRPTQQQVLTRLVTALAPAGLLCLGHSENVYGLVHELEHVGSTMYQRKED